MSLAVADLEPVKRLSRDIVVASRVLSPDEARFLVDAYYTLQDYRKAADSQTQALTKSGEPCSVLAWLGDQTEGLEGQIRRALASWADSQAVGVWSQSIVGIGPVIAAGLLAHIDIEKAPTAGHIWRFAGLDPSQSWNKGEKRPWNAGLKVLTWKIGESFVKVSNHPKDVYGKLYAKRRVQEQERNDAGAFAEQAAAALQKKRIGKDTVAYAAYSQGRLPDAHLHARAKRWAVKIFLSHWQTVAWFIRYEQAPPKPYVLDMLGHAHEIQVPNAETVPGLTEALRRR